jgi:hypothetical protein
LQGQTVSVPPAALSTASQAAPAAPSPARPA